MAPLRSAAPALLAMSLWAGARAVRHHHAAELEESLRATEAIAVGEATKLADEAGSTLGCVDGSGKAVDFYYAFKYPNGYEYAYMDVGSSKLVKGKGTLDDSSSPVSRTLASLYAAGSTASYAFWNDDHPFASADAPASMAHSKGVVAFKGSQGFYLLHSLPNFAAGMDDIQSKASGNPFADASNKYGQSYLCITVAKAGFDTVGQLMTTDRPSVYSAADGAKVGTSFTSWALNGQHDANSNPAILTVASKGGQKWTAFGKSSSWGQDLYEDLVAEHFNVDMYTETWQNGRGSIPNYVKGKDGKKHSITNIDTVAFPGQTWQESQDHSKWAVDTNGKILCVGGINRQEGQRKRGGGTLCIQDSGYAGTMLAVVKTLQPDGAL